MRLRKDLAAISSLITACRKSPFSQLLTEGFRVRVLAGEPSLSVSYRHTLLLPFDLVTNLVHIFPKIRPF